MYEPVALPLHDRMMESVFAKLDDAAALFAHHEPLNADGVDVLTGGHCDALVNASVQLGLALADDDEIDPSVGKLPKIGRNPNDIETVYMFHQANSELFTVIRFLMLIG